MTYKEARTFLKKSSEYGSRFALHVMIKLMNALGNPQNAVKYIHIAGTNGKGSTAAMLSKILTEAGYKTGLYTSPYLEGMHEQIQMDSVAISEEAFAKAANVVATCIQNNFSVDDEQPTEFEVFTAMAFVYFNTMACDVVVMETGMGGRVDATNVIAAPLLSVITALDMDHSTYLGDTIEAIASQKAGIIKSGVPVVTYPQVHSAETVLEKTCDALNASLTKVDLSRAKRLRTSLKGTDFVWDEIPYHLSLVAPYQVENAAIVLTCIEVLAVKLPISAEAIAAGLAKAYWPGRMEVLNESPLIIIDGAHNIHGVLGLRKGLEILGKGRRTIGVMGVLADKDVHGMLEAILPSLDHIIATEPISPRALSADALAARIESLDSWPEATESNIESAVLAAIQVAQPNDLIICFGSLYLIGHVRKLIQEMHW